MNNDQINRGNQLKSLRKSKKMTLKALAAETGLSVGFLSKIENGEGNPSINNIQKICYALDTTVNELMSPEASPAEQREPKKQQPSYVVKKDGRGLLYDFSGLVRFESVFSENHHFKLDVLTLNGDTSKCFTSTHSYDEIGIVASGTLKATLNGNEDYILEEGDSIIIRAQTSHSLSSARDGEICISHWIEITNEE